MQVKKHFIQKDPPLPRGIFYLAAILLCWSTAVHSQPRIKVLENKRSFGQVDKGEVIRIPFELKNEGDQPLLIESAEASCHCTTAKFSKEPVLPRATTTVLVSFDTKGAYGRQDRVVEVHSNAKGSPHRLRFRGTVNQKPDQPRRN